MKKDELATLVLFVLVVVLILRWLTRGQQRIEVTPELAAGLTDVSRPLDYGSTPPAPPSASSPASQPSRIDWDLVNALLVEGAPDGAKG